MQQKLKAAQDRKKIYVDLKRTPREFQVGDHVDIKINLKKSTFILGKCKKLEPRCEPFEILAKLGLIAYQLSLPPNIQVHNVFTFLF